MKHFLKVALAAAGLLGIIGTAQAAAPKAKVKIALIVETTMDDKGWGQSMHDAIKAVQQRYGPALIEYSYSEKMKPVDAGSAARQYALRGFDVIICHGSQFKNVVLELADTYPKVSFAFGTSTDVGPKNVFTYMPESEQTGYINGILAGSTTKSNMIGVVGPVDGGDPARYIRGFTLGVKSVNPKATIKVAFTGTFGDYVKAGELAHTNILAGVDVLTGTSQQALGALRAVAQYKDKTVWWLGLDFNQLIIPESEKVLAASNYDNQVVVEEILARREAKVLGGETIPLNYKNNGLVYRLNEKNAAAISPAARKAVMDALKSLKAGTLTVKWREVKL